MQKICFPHYERGEFDSLEDVYKFLRNKSMDCFEYILVDIIRYNKCYRDFLRENGMDMLVERLSGEIPLTSMDKRVVEYLYEWWNMTGGLADYNIQCVNVEDKITIYGHTFNGLKDILEHCEMKGRDNLFGFETYRNDGKGNDTDVHVGMVYEMYPVFDSSDYKDRRMYQNVIFRRSPIAESDLKEAFAIPHKVDFCMVNESIPDKLLPVIYYKGYGKYMLLATE
ncbi:MAG: hypothetical protein IJ421_04810 [Prevotella sp.]|nr:hypothetical protein [Prevotella sp.]